MNRRSALCSLVITPLLATVAIAQQIADPNFDTRVANPAFRDRHPGVLLDEAHFNFHTADGTYKPFVDLITSDGYIVHINRRLFSSQGLERYDILVIAGALGTKRYTDPDAARSAFTVNEQHVVAAWVRDGGSLLIMGDHPPFGSAVADLLSRFDIEYSGGYTIDTSPDNRLERSIHTLVFSRQNGLLGDSPLTNGRDVSEHVEGVVTFTGNSFKAPSGSLTFLHVSPTGWEVFAHRPVGTIERFKSPPQGLMLRPPASAAGRAQGVAVRFGKGRVVAVGDGALLSAQLVGEDREPKGWNWPGNDTRQLTLNIMHWLSGLLDTPSDGANRP